MIMTNKERKELLEEFIDYASYIGETWWLDSVAEDFLKKKYFICEMETLGVSRCESKCDGCK